MTPYGDSGSWTPGDEPRGPQAKSAEDRDLCSIVGHVESEKGHRGSRVKFCPVCGDSLPDAREASDER